MRILLDYRPALRHRTGVGEFAHHLAAALLARLDPADRLVLFSSSWKDRLPPDALPGTGRVDARIPVRVLNFAWHRLEWPPVEWLSGAVDVTHSQHVLMMPSRAAARVVTIHDLYFLDNPAGTSAEIRRDYARLAADHARRADAVVVSSGYTRTAVIERLGVDAARVVLCPPGAPDWPPRPTPRVAGPILFIGTIEPRKNLKGLLEAYGRLVDANPSVPELVVAGHVRGTVPGMTREPGTVPVRYLGYVSDEHRMRLYREASMLVIPSYDEGFGLPALEAMTIGLPVVASRRGSLPEVLDDAAMFVDPDDHDGIAGAMKTILDEPDTRDRLTRAGLARARTFRWDTGADRVYQAYEDAVRRSRSRR